MKYTIKKQKSYVDKELDLYHKSTLQDTVHMKIHQENLYN